MNAGGTDNFSKFAKGKCRTMCPLKEMQMREKERMLHILEIQAGTENQRTPKVDQERAVKEFVRSAVGKSMTDDECLRPPEILLKTIQYLLDDVICNEIVTWIVKYDFIMDRLRSIRQDMIIQNISRAYSISLLQPIVRFYAYSGYRLCDEKINVFDPHINNKHLHECLNRLLIIYDDIEQSFQLPTTQFDNIEFIKESRPQFEAMYIILNIENETALTRMLRLAKCWRTPVVQIAILLALYYLKSNFIQVCRCMKKLPPLLSAVAALHLSEIRRKTFQIMSVSHSSKNQTFPLSKLKALLLYGSVDDLVADCTHYGIKIVEDSIYFDKNAFNRVIKKTPDRKEWFVEEKLKNINESSLLLFSED